jgi:hypothetical protein
MGVSAIDGAELVGGIGGLSGIGGGGVAIRFAPGGKKLVSAACTVVARRCFDKHYRRLLEKLSTKKLAVG